MTFVGIIPARYASTRFPGKPLCDIAGKPMIWHVYQSVMKWKKWQAVYVATDDQRIVTACQKLGIPSITTKNTHTDCLDRAAEVVEILEKRDEAADRYIIIQGDEPLFNVETLNCDLSADIINFFTEVKDPQEIYDPNAVKVVVSDNWKAIYFSRYSIPYHDKKTKRSNQEPQILKQIGVYVFSGDRLKQYTSMSQSYLESMEGIGLLRLLEAGIGIQMMHTEHDSISVDTDEDRQRIVSLIRSQH